MDPAQPPQVTHHDPQPEGSVPKKRQVQIIVGACALVVVTAALMSLFRNQPSQMPLPQPPEQKKYTLPTPAKINQGMAGLKRDQDQEALDADQEKRKKTDWPALNRQAEAAGPQPAATAPHEQVDPIEQKKKQLEFDSLFAPSIVPQPDLTKQAEKTALLDRQTVSSEERRGEARKGEENAAPPEEANLHTLPEGSTIEFVLTNTIIGEFPGPVNLMVTTPVYCHDGDLALLIPQGTRVLGKAAKTADQFQSRMSISLHRLLMPDLTSVKLDDIGLDHEGAAALHDKVNHHYLAKFGTAVALGLISGVTLYGTNNYYAGDSGDIYRQQVASHMSQAATQILNRQLNRLPTITIRSGTRVKIMLAEDLKVKAYGTQNQ